MMTIPNGGGVWFYFGACERLKPDGMKLSSGHD